MVMYKKRKYIKAMLEAIDGARTSVWNESHRTTRTNGLRAIKTFERVNGVAFNPFDESHLLKVAGEGIDEAFFRRAKRFFSEYNLEKAQWEYEDQLMPNLSKEDYNKMFPYSRVVCGVRMFPFFEIWRDDDGNAIRSYVPLHNTVVE